MPAHFSDQTDAPRSADWTTGAGSLRSARAWCVGCRNAAAIVASSRRSVAIPRNGAGGRGDRSAMYEKVTYYVVSDWIVLVQFFVDSKKAYSIA